MDDIFGTGYDPDFYSEEEDALDLQDEDFEFKDIMNQLVEKEVQKRVQAKFDNFNHVTQTYDKMTQEIENLKSELRKRDRDLQQAKVEIYKEAKAEGQRIAFGGHAIGDQGFVIRYQYNNGDCPDCGRKGRIMAAVNLNGESTLTEVRCPTCDGLGRKTGRESVVVAAHVRQITSKIWNDGKTSKVDLYVKPNGFDAYETSPESFFATEAEAAEKIKNEKGKKK